MVNGQQLAVLVRTHKAGDEVKFTIIRQGQRKEVAVKLIEKEVPTLDEKNLWGQPGPTGSILKGSSGTLMLNNATISPANKAFDILRSNNATMKMIDGNYTFSFTTQDGQTNLQAKDRQGNSVFEGPVDTDDQIKQLPEEIADKVKPMLLKLQLLQPKPAKKS